MTHKKLSFIVLSIFVIGFMFWTGSRYPQLDEKALMGGDTPIMGISFDVVQEINDGDASYTKVWKNTINWIDTNKKGMTFGLLFAASLILLFLRVSKNQFENKWLNSGIGLIIGAPLGVCVNCATPIAKGMSDAGSKTETALATMISSPTFNVIVLSMLFALVPDYMLVIKIGLTLFLILICIPLLVKYFAPPVILQQSSLGELSETAFPFETKEIKKINSTTWFGAGVWFMWNYIRSFWYICRTAVPLMLLAGLLGNIMVTYLPLESLVTMVEGRSLLITFFLVITISALGALLPVPMTFDVLVVVILMTLGLSPMYGMILLFTLGTFSIYPYFIIHKDISKKLANGLLVTVIGLGILSGLMAHYWYTKTAQEETEAIAAVAFSDEIGDLWNVSSNGGLSAYDTISFTAHPIEYDSEFITENFEVSKVPYRENKTNNLPFTRYDAIDIGIHLPYSYSILNTISPLNNPRAIASGDINNDGYPDIIAVSNSSLYQFINHDGKGFISSNIKTMEGLVLNAAMADLNNDGYPDLVVSFFNQGAFIIYNDAGTFSAEKAIPLPMSYTPVVSSEIGFADLDKNGELDIFLGIWNSTFGAKYVMEKSKNEGFYQNDGKWERFDLNSFGGQTHSALLSDIDMDGNIDILEGNDFQAADVFHFNEGEKNFKTVTNGDNVFPITTRTTMSVTSADIDNDLIPEIYIAQIYTQGAKATKSIEEACSCIDDSKENKKCIEILTHRQSVNQALGKNSFSYCPDYDLEGCKIRFTYKQHFQKVSRNRTLPPSFLSQYPNLPFFTEYLSKFEPKEETLINKNQINKNQITQRNKDAVLFKSDGKRKFKDVAVEYGVGKTGWAWNAKFADLNNDGWKDLLVANGFLFGTNPLQSNILYKNMSGLNFDDVTAELGFDNYLPCIGYTYLDFDLDGDIDVFIVPSIGPLIVHENNNVDQNNSITIELKDNKGNVQGIGAKVFIYYGNNLNQYKEIQLSGGFKSGDELVAHFGLGKETVISKVIVQWPTGKKTEINKPLSAGFRYKVSRR